MAFVETRHSSFFCNTTQLYIPIYYTTFNAHNAQQCFLFSRNETGLLGGHLGHWDGWMDGWREIDGCGGGMGFHGNGGSIHWPYPIMTGWRVHLYIPAL
ncbi:hypothetical protein ACQKWADRAFT_294165, partial [Trichoderma austrokoningii]